MAVSEVIDEGGLPGPTNGDHSHPDLVDSYLINGFGIGYCDESPAGMSSFRTRFYESYQVCQFTMPPPVAVIDLGGLPGAGSCWIVTVDLQGTPEEFCLAADGGSASPGGDNDPDLDRFAWSYEPTGSSSAGLLIAGNPLATDAGYTIPAGSFAPPPRAATGTFFGPPLQCAPSGGSGYLTNDTFLFMGPPQGHRCAYFGGYRNHNGCGAPTGSPYASFHVKLYTQAGVTCDGSSFGMQYCVSTPNSTGGTGDLQIFGSAAASADGEAMVASGLAPGSFGYSIT